MESASSAVGGFVAGSSVVCYCSGGGATEDSLGGASVDSLGGAFVGSLAGAFVGSLAGAFVGSLAGATGISQGCALFFISSSTEAMKVGSLDLAMSSAISPSVISTFLSIASCSVLRPKRIYGYGLYKTPSELRSRLVISTASLTIALFLAFGSLGSIVDSPRAFFCLFSF